MELVVCFFQILSLWLSTFFFPSLGRRGKKILCMDKIGWKYLEELICGDHLYYFSVLYLKYIFIIKKSNDTLW